MGIEKLISTGAILAVLAASTGQLPKVMMTVYVAQLKLLQESQASKWPKAQLLMGSF